MHGNAGCPESEQSSLCYPSRGRRTDAQILRQTILSLTYTLVGIIVAYALHVFIVRPFVG